MKYKIIPTRGGNYRGSGCRSANEYAIAQWLSEESIDFYYEKPFLFRDAHGLFRIVYPDFYLQGCVILEYFGRGNENAKRMNEMKIRSYEKSGIPFIILYPKDLHSGKWKILIKQALQDIYRERLEQCDALPLLEEEG